MAMPPSRPEFSYDLALAAALAVVLMLALAKYQAGEMREEMLAARAGEERARRDLDGALEKIHELRDKRERPAE